MVKGWDALPTEHHSENKQIVKISQILCLKVFRSLSETHCSFTESDQKKTTALILFGICKWKLQHLLVMQVDVGYESGNDSMSMVWFGVFLDDF